MLFLKTNMRHGDPPPWGPIYCGPTIYVVINPEYGNINNPAGRPSPPEPCQSLLSNLLFKVTMSFNFHVYEISLNLGECEAKIFAWKTSKI